MNACNFLVPIIDYYGHYILDNYCPSAIAGKQSNSSCIRMKGVEITASDMIWIDTDRLKDQAERT